MDAHILAVDDNPEIREIIEILLTGEGFAVDQAGDGTQALAMLKEKHYDLIILDIMMPGMNGYEATKMIRSLDREDAKVIPIIAMTANAFTEDRLRAKEAGMNEHIAKPFDVKLLVKIIHKLVH